VGLGTSIWRARNAAEICSELLLDRAGWTQEAASVPRDARVLPADPYLAAKGNRCRQFLRLEPTVYVNGLHLYKL
jgi:hypothetical protein